MKKKNIFAIILALTLLVFNTVVVHAEEDYNQKIFTSYRLYTVSLAYNYLLDNNYITEDQKVVCLDQGNGTIYVYYDVYLKNGYYYSNEFTESSNSKKRYYIVSFKMADTEAFENGEISVSTSSSSSYIFHANDYLELSNVTNSKYFCANFDIESMSENVPASLKRQTMQEAQQEFFGWMGNGESSGGNVSVNVLDTTALEQKINNIFILILFAISYAWFINPMFKQIKDIMQMKGD